jgi:hypothetical protein
LKKRNESVFAYSAARTPRSWQKTSSAEKLTGSLPAKRFQAANEPFKTKSESCAEADDPPRFRRNRENEWAFALSYLPQNLFAASH